MPSRFCSSYYFKYTIFHFYIYRLLRSCLDLAYFFPFHLGVKQFLSVLIHPGCYFVGASLAHSHLLRLQNSQQKQAGFLCLWCLEWLGANQAYQHK